MAVRATMTGLITLVRGLIDDPAGTDATFTDEYIQQQLDAQREYALNEKLEALPEPDESTYLKWSSSHKHWQTDVAFTDPAGTVLVPESADYLNGYFTFGSHCYQVYATGFHFDVYAACVTLLMVWAGRIEQDITKFSADGSSYEFAGERESKLTLANEYARISGKFGMKSIRMVRDDHFIN